MQLSRVLLLFPPGLFFASETSSDKISQELNFAGGVNMVYDNNGMITTYETENHNQLFYYL